MPDQSPDHRALDELERRLSDLEASRKTRSPFPDRIVSYIGEAETIAGLIMLIVTPFDAVSALLSGVGIATWIYDAAVKSRRERREKIERDRQIDLIRSELDKVRRG